MHHRLAIGKLALAAHVLDTGVLGEDARGRVSQFGGARCRVGGHGVNIDRDGDVEGQVQQTMQGRGVPRPAQVVRRGLRGDHLVV
jgi:hypothetical protein